MKYRVFFETTISYYRDVEADDADSAIEEAEIEGLGQVMFLNHDFPDMGEWEAIEAEPLEG